MKSKKGTVYVKVGWEIRKNSTAHRSGHRTSIIDQNLVISQYKEKNRTELQQSKKPAYRVAGRLGVGKTQIQTIKKHKNVIMADFWQTLKPIPSKRCL